MASIIVFFILTVLKVNIDWTTGFSSNVHGIMTPEAISETFGTDDAPEYQVLSIVLPEANKHQADGEIHVKVEINDTEINLNFKPTAGYLATRSTPVWLAVTDRKAHHRIRYDPLPNAMKDIGEFKMYQDVDNDAAIVVYTDPDHQAIVEGIVTSNYAIKSLPRRLINQTLKVDVNNFVESSLHHKRSIGPNADEVTGHYVLFKSPPPVKNAQHHVYRHKRNQPRLVTIPTRNIPEAVYPEILLVLDHNAIRNHTITQALRFMLAFWNGVDMIYSQLDKPKVHLNIAGIIISADDTATPYLARDTSIKIRPYTESILDSFAKYFGRELERFPLKHYDMILVMTPLPLCRKEAYPCDILLGYATIGGACTSEYEVEEYKENDGVGIVHYDWMYGGVDTAVHESAHLFGVGHDEGKNFTADCHVTDGYVMAATNEFSHQSFKWSPCSKRFFRDYFSSNESQCMDNPPMWTKPVKEVLPGRWLTLNGQCQNSGFKESCTVPNTFVCKLKACRAKKSNVCQVSEPIPLPGTKCGANKYCDSSTTCVDE